MLSDTPSIAGSTIGGKIFIHKFETTNDNPNKLNLLNFNKKIIYIASGNLDPNNEREILIVASKNSVTAYGKFFGFSFDIFFA